MGFLKGGVGAIPPGGFAGGALIPQLLSEVSMPLIMWIYRLHYLILTRSTLTKLTNILKRVIQGNHELETASINNTNISEQKRTGDNFLGVEITVSCTPKLNIIMI